MPRTINFEPHFDAITTQYGKELDADMVKEYVANNPDVSYQTVTKYLNKWKISRGKWNIKSPKKQDAIPTATFQVQQPQSTKLTKTEKVEQNLIPAKDNTFIPFGNFPSLKKVIASREFYPTFITGMSGNGKTFGVEQACSQLNRELIRVNITVETDEDDLIGGFRLVNGQTVWHNGAVVEALERGAILLLDEIDLASNKILCLQPILEGKGLFLKKIGEYIKPANGFNVIATANTKGKGSDDGRFIGTNVLNEAFLERFPITFEQEYPTVAVEKRIMTRLCEEINIPLTGDHKEFINYLCDWSDIVRRTFNDGGVDEIISTRRLVHIMRAYQIFGDKMKAMQMCLNRFDDETKESFMQLYTKLDEHVTKEENVTES